MIENEISESNIFIAEATVKHTISVSNMCVYI